jgi:transcriptional regulator with XRE-family HTH domain
MARRSNILVRFGKRMRELRKKRGFSQESFAAHCGLDRTYIGGIERGERNLALNNIAVIANALGLTVSELTEGIDTGRNDG